MFRNKAAVLHIAIWAVLLAIFFLINARGQNQEAAIVIFLYGGLNIILFYWQYFFVNPLLFSLNQYWRASFFIILALIISIAVKYAFALHFEDVILHYGDNKDKVLTPVQYVFAAFITGVFFMFLSTAVYVVSSNFQNQQKQKNLENEKLNAELTFLKSQINPHFLFNSLNNIYSLAYQKSEKTPEAILKLSEIMRYMLYESNEGTVLLANEINYLKNYIELQKLRFKESVYVNLEVDVDEENHRIMPLLLISFLENAFKHGVSTNQEKPIHLMIKIENGRLHFKAENAKNQDNKDQTKGVGLANLRRRLELGYPERHTINVVESENYYSSELFIYL